MSAARQACLIVVFAKAPLAGYAKTRLIAALGAQGAAALALRMLRHTIDESLAAGLGPVELCCAPNAGHPAFAAAADARLIITDQGEGDLGQRMARAMDRGLAQYDKVLLIGSDAPTLDAAVLRSAAAALARHDAVFVPALDGGYVLVGLRRGIPEIFEDMPWSTPLVMQRTRERLGLPGVGASHAELAPLPDIDVPADLVHLPEGWL